MALLKEVCNMKKQMKNVLTMALAVTMILSCLSALSLPFAAADTAPTIDGVKDDAYTDDRCLTVTQVVPAVGSGQTVPNTTNSTIKLWYTWDDTTVYCFMQVTEPGQTDVDALYDILYFGNRVNFNSSPILTQAGGGYAQFSTADGSVTSASSVMPPLATAHVYSDNKQTRSYEVSFTRDTSSDGFTVSPVVYGRDQYIVAYSDYYSSGTINKKVYYNDASSWKESKGEPVGEQPDEPVVDGIDGEKDERYSDDKCLTVTTAYAQQGASGTIPNVTNTTVKVWYAWTDETIYLFMQVTEPGQTDLTGIYDILYYANKAEGLNGSAIHAQPGGGYLQTAVATGAPVSDGSQLAPTHKAAKISADKQTRCYEMSLPRNAAATGFAVSPVVYGRTDYFVSYVNYYNAGNLAKVVSFTDENTWQETKGEPVNGGDEPADPEAVDGIDGVKDERYTDEKVTTVNKTYRVVGAADCDNTAEVVVKTYYAWNDDYTYIYMDVDDPEKDPLHPLTYLMFYFRDNFDYAPTDDPAGFIFKNSGGGWMQYNVKTGAMSADTANWSSFEKATAKTANGYALEFRVPRKANAAGFIISPVVQMGDDSDPQRYAVSYVSAYNLDGGVKRVLYNNSASWVDTSAYEEAASGTTTDLPGIDGVKDERYSEDKMTLISKAYGGQSQGAIYNSKHVFLKLYYNWDDNYNYIFAEVHDPFNMATEDVFYYASHTQQLSDSVHTLPGGGYITFLAATGTKYGGKDMDNRLLQYGSVKENGVRCYEFVLPKSNNADGFMISPVISGNQGRYVVAYNTTYTNSTATKLIRYGDPTTWKDETQVDPDVVMDPAATFDPIFARINALPDDPQTVTLADHEQAILSLRDELAAMPGTWSVFMDEDLLAKFQADYDRLVELMAAEHADEIAAVEALVNALPDEVDLANEEAVEDVAAAVAELGDLFRYADPAVIAKYENALAQIRSYKTSVVIDGKLDSAYEATEEVPVSYEIAMGSAGGILDMSPATNGLIYTMADDDYAYIYFMVYDADQIYHVPQGVDYSNVINQYDGIAFYLDMDPGNRVIGIAYQDASEPTDNMMYFCMTADGDVPDSCISAKTAFLRDPANFCSFTTDEGYGFEMRVARVPGEETFMFNAVIVNPVYTENPSTGEMEFNYNDSRYIAQGEYWAGTYANYAEMYFEDYPVMMDYMQIIKIINSLPAADAVVDRSPLKKITRVRSALALLSDAHMAKIPADVLKHLDDVEAAVLALPPESNVKLGDVNNDAAIDAKDALLALKAAVGKATLTADQTKAADVNGDGAINAKDALEILKFAVRKIDKFSAEK